MGRERQGKTAQPEDNQREKKKKANEEVGTDSERPRQYDEGAKKRFKRKMSHTSQGEI